MPSRLVVVHQDGPLASLTDVEVDCPCCVGCERNGDHLASFAGDGQCAVPLLYAEIFDIGVKRLGYAETVQSQETGKGVIPATGESSLDEEHPKFIAVKTHRMGLVVQARPSHMRCWGCGYDLLFYAVPVEPRDRG
jgi:hypothetical protein